MIAEHEFVTTMPAKEAFEAVEASVEPLGFKRDAIGDLSSADWVRGKKKPQRNIFTKLPMKLRMGYDRGRVNLALAIDEPGKPQRLPHVYGLALLAGLETRIGHEPVASNGLAEAASIFDKARRRERAHNIIAWTVLSLILLSIFGLIVFAAMSA